eukprot:TRINITY_DN5985_c0_g1_i1.p1 TRINITY_DN5985_c0_g1~~TRINITY_DN5985_c0_g1_i1.p1  ORF type:complete len:224 (+),score=43.79 TRINITY_DN5985_c0_g1_i1:63-734(+)
MTDAISGLPTPSLSHLNPELLEKVYEPAEDTFLFLDAFWHERTFLKTKLKPNLIVELGSGSGTIITALAKFLGPEKLYFATDVNPNATLATSETARFHGVNVEVIGTDLLSGLERLFGRIDVLIFNPPYVPTTEEELEEAVEKKDISASWSGGENGLHCLNRLVPALPRILSLGGCFYVVAIKENNPKLLVDSVTRLGFDAQVVLKRRAGSELLFILKFQKVK